MKSIVEVGREGDMENWDGKLERRAAVTDAGARPSVLATTGGALLGWWRATTLDALLVGVLWLTGLELLHVPLAPLWALLGALCQFIPSFGGMIALIGPVLSVAVTNSGGEDWYRLGYVLGLYAIIVVLEGLVIGPYVLHRSTLVPWWAALLGPVVLGILLPPWGVLIAPPLLAVVFAFAGRKGGERI